MRHALALACDRKLKFQETIEEKCPWLQIVFDYFHIVNNFNDQVVYEVLKDKQRCLIEECILILAKYLKKTRYILTASRKTAQKKDEYAAEELDIRKGSSLFKADDNVEGGL